MTPDALEPAAVRVPASRPPRRAFRLGVAVCLISSAVVTHAASPIAGTGSPGEFLALLGYACVSLAFTSLIEAVIYGRLLRLGLGRALRVSALVNLASAVGGIPLAILLGGTEHQLVPMAVYWGWRTLGVFLGACVIELLVARWRLRDRPLPALAAAVLCANAASFGLYLAAKLAL